MASPIDIDSLLLLVQCSLLPPEAIAAEGCAAIESTGDCAILYSSGPLERIIRYLKEEFLPAIQSKQQQFDIWITEGIATSKDSLYATGSALVAAMARCDAATREYIQGMVNEGLSGPKTTRIAIILGTIDALQKLVSSAGMDGFNHLSHTDWWMIALAYLLFKDDLNSK